MAKDRRTLEKRLEDLKKHMQERFVGEPIEITHMRFDNKFRVVLGGLTAYVDTYRDPYSVGKLFRHPDKIKSY